MEQVPLSMRVLTTPIQNTTQEQPNREQSTLSENESKSTQDQMLQNNGLGLYGYPMLDLLGNHQGSIQQPSPSMKNPNFSYSTPHPRYSSKPSPNILSAEYDPFAPLPSDVASSYGSAMFNSRPTDAIFPPASPPTSGVASHRSSFSSAPASETYSHSESFPTFNSRIKMENHLDWNSDRNNILSMVGTSADTSALATAASCYPGCLEDTFLQQQGETAWPKADALDIPNSSVAIGGSGLSETFRHPASEPRRLSSSVSRTRTPRRMTSREDANYQCSVKGCGKLFSRSYNFKAHMETHDAGRVYPFPCTIQDCNKKFVRKTDLQRHHQSVHMKERNYRCDFCDRYFARKDTLRRHMEDGCSKRFDLAFGYNQDSAASQSDVKNEPRTAPIQSPLSSSSVTYSRSIPGPLSDLQENYLSRAEFRSGDNVQDPVWST